MRTKIFSICQKSKPLLPQEIEVRRLTLDRSDTCYLYFPRYFNNNFNNYPSYLSGVNLYSL